MWAAALQLKPWKPVLGNHLIAFPRGGFRRQYFAILVFANVISHAASAAVLIKQIGGEGHFIAGASADDVANRLADGLTDEVETGNFKSRESSGGRVERVLARHKIGLRPVAGILRCAVGHILE